MEPVKTKTIRQTAAFKATPHEVYELLMDSKKHGAFTQSSASISRKVGGVISAYDGYIVGKNLELIADKKIVQSWRGAEDDWPETHFSTVTFLLSKMKSGTKLVFTHEHVPELCAASIKQGWIDHYWTPMKKMLEK